ncbi:hypothetical protein FOA52_000698 [Chlamydomonas sp. UWO 241]|nr:hypothetical protein FOA52_000698 [Chlamydomonas sp. UWO 241]
MNTHFSNVDWKVDTLFIVHYAGPVDDKYRLTMGEVAENSKYQLYKAQSHSQGTVQRQSGQRPAPGEAGLAGDAPLSRVLCISDVFRLADAGAWRHRIPRPVRREKLANGWWPWVVQLSSVHAVPPVVNESSPADAGMADAHALAELLASSIDGKVPGTSWSRCVSHAVTVSY